MKVFVISLKESVDRQQSIKAQLDPLNINWEIFSAVNGKEGIPSRLEKYQADSHRRYFRSRPLSLGEKGCYASHYLLWEKCIEINEPILILEDDVIVTPFFQKIHDHLTTIHSKYDYIKVDPSNGECKKVEFDGELQIVRLLSNFDGTCGYSITPKAAKQFLLNSKKWTSPVDGFIGEGYNNNIVSYSLVTYAVYPMQCFGDKEDKFASTVQEKNKIKVPLPFKLLREITRLIRFIRLISWNFKCRNL